MALVSAVITTHKRKADIVERAVKSVLAQTHKNIELFVVDDSPAGYAFRDEVRQMVERYADRNVTYIPHETCSGACVARNTGLAEAKGEFIGFLDDDDEWHPEKVERLLAGFDRDEVALVYCNKIIKNDLTNESDVLPAAKHTGYAFDELIKLNFVGSTSFPLLRTCALRDAGGFDPEQPALQDLDVWLRVAKKYMINYVDAALNIYHKHGEDQISKSAAKRVHGQERLIEKHREYLSKHPKAHWRRLLHLILDYANNKQYKKAFAVWCRAVTLNPLEIRMNVSHFLTIVKTFIRTIM